MSALSPISLLISLYILSHSHRRTGAASVPARLVVLEQMEPWVEQHVLLLLKPAKEAWQPEDMVPDAAALGADGFHAACLELRECAARRALSSGSALRGVPDAHLVCLVGNMVTEEALPTYQSMVNRFESARDVTGADGTAWARWICRWSAEENHHDDVLNRYMYLSGRLDMRQVERTVHRLISSGMAMHALVSPDHGFSYVAFQERATAATRHATSAPMATTRSPASAAPSPPTRAPRGRLHPRRRDAPRRCPRHLRHDRCRLVLLRWLEQWQQVLLHPWLHLLKHLQPRRRRCRPVRLW
ncbi:Os03g0741000 [Oryza sativa Japonica Group]|uniref:Os03g0741000 protein n=3 Tax=Oryza sativa subsp. japonica TaxID=39947 RepID=A0A0P0W3E5_ORYSJ|nr:hypothetical protein EE612_020349 [Oryza sativa]BAS86306.1 Os03g0741000 [Oryza sativa Japonica Group]